MPRALIADSSAPVSGALRQILESIGFEVTVSRSPDEAVERARDLGPDLVFAASNRAFDGETLCRKLKKRHHALPVALVYPPEEEDPQPRAEAVARYVANRYPELAAARKDIVEITADLLRGLHQTREFEFGVLGRARQHRELDRRRDFELAPEPLLLHLELALLRLRQLTALQALLQGLRHIVVRRDELLHGLVPDGVEAGR